MHTSPSRRVFLQNGSLLLLGAGVASTTPQLWADDKPADRAARLCLVTDLHYADKPAAGSRYYRETLGKLAEAAEQFKKDEPDCTVCLGDIIDAADSVEKEKTWLATIHKEFNALPGKKYYVLGNHCVDTLTKKEYLEGVGQEKSHYSFDVGDFHFVVLDACFRADGTPYERKNFKWQDTNVPAEQVKWLRDDLKASGKKTILFAHQRLDLKDEHAIKNAPDIRAVLEESKQVLAVFMGHTHKNDLKEINGIHYCTLVAMIEGSGKEKNGYSTLDVLKDGTLKLTGFRQQKKQEWAAVKSASSTSSS